jgi:hypothetical protein
MKAWFSTLLATIIAGVIVYWFTDGFSHWWPKPKMGPLLSGVGLDHNDIAAGGWVSLTSAEACSDLCYARDDCKAMTYVISNRSCWLKYAVPSRTSNKDEISAIKR